MFLHQITDYEAFCAPPGGTLKAPFWGVGIRFNSPTTHPSCVLPFNILKL